MVTTLTNPDTDKRPYKDLAHRIAEARAKVGVSQPELARLAKVSTGYVGFIETGRRRPSPEILRRIAKALSIEYTDLAVLARFMDAPAGPVSIDVPPELAADVREIASQPPAIVRAALNMIRELRTVFLTEAPEQPDERATRDPAERGPADAQGDDRSVQPRDGTDPERARGTEDSPEGQRA